MSNICDVCLEPRLSNAVNSVRVNTDVVDFVLGAVSINSLCAVHPRSVANFAGLIILDNVAPGTIMFVEDVNVPVIYNNCRWLGLDGRVFIDGCTRTTMWTWGNNSNGELGNGTAICSSSPGTASGGGTTWCQTSAGRFHIAAVKTDGTAWTWGGNGGGQLGNLTVVARSSPGTTVGGGTTWCQISAGNTHTAAVKTDGTAWTWGNNSVGTLGDGTVVATSSPGTLAGGGTTWCQISAGNQHTTAVKTDGTIWTWGRNGQGQLGDNTVVSRSSPGTVAGGGNTWCQTIAGRYHTTAIKTNGTAWTWGYNLRGNLGDGTVVYRSSPGTTAGGGTTWCQISAGDALTAAVKTDGTAWTWGRNANGQLGDLTVICRSSPVTPVGGGTTWCDIGAGSYHTAAIKTDGTAWTWGGNGTGQLGIGTAVDRSSPGVVSGNINSWCQISLGRCHTTAISLTRTN